jgi:hypothetical protein
MIKCPDSPRAASLKRLVTTNEGIGNFEQEFVKSKSKTGRERLDPSFPSAFFSLISEDSLFFSSDLGFRVHVLFFQNLKKCRHFEWTDEYVQRPQV